MLRSLWIDSGKVSVQAEAGINCAGINCAWRTCPELPGITRGTCILLLAASAEQFLVLGKKWGGRSREGFPGQHWGGSSDGLSPLSPEAPHPSFSTSLALSAAAQPHGPAGSSLLHLIFLFIYFLPSFTSFQVVGERGIFSGVGWGVYFSCLCWVCCSEKLHRVCHLAQN